jgi:hypothetical protein
VDYGTYSNECSDRAEFMPGGLVQGVKAETDDSYLDVTLSSGEHELIYVIADEKVAEIVVGEDNAQVRFFLDTNGDGRKQDDESYFKPDNISLKVNTKVENVYYTLYTGWNLIGFEIISEEWSSASKLLDEIYSNDIEATHIATYSDGKWKMYSQRVDEEGNMQTFGDDFSVLPGRGYFVKVLNTGKFTAKGQRFAESVPIDMSNGWNLISVQAPNTDYTAGSFIDLCLNTGIGCDSVAKFESGLYETVVKDEGVLFGNDFNIIAKSGYFVRVESGGGAKLTP